MQPAPRRATFDDWLAARAGESIELIDGRIVRKAMPLPAHGRAQSALSRFIGGPFDFDGGEPGGWWIASEVDVRLGPDIVRPDVVGWRRERAPKLPDGHPVELRPDWVCEVLSPSNHAHDRLTKANLYGRPGIPHLWLVDPHEGLLEAYVLADGVWSRRTAVGRGETARVPPFEAIELEIDRLFAPAE